MRRNAHGVVVEEATLRAGVLDGPFHLYDDGGRLIRAAGYVDGVLDGVAVDYDARGLKLAETTWRAGAQTGPFRQYRRGRLSAEMTLAEGAPDGAARFYAPDGALSALVAFRGGLRHGVMEVYGPGGTLAQRMRYADDLPDGWSETYGPDGAITHRVCYRRGVKTGREVAYQDGREASVTVHPDTPDAQYRDATGADPVAAFYASLAVR